MVSERRHEGADQKHSSQIDIKVCALCKDGPRCKYSNVKEPGSARSVTDPSAIGDKVAHTDCDMTVPTVQLYSVVGPGLAHTNFLSGTVSPT